MGLWKSLLDRMNDKREELQRKAVKKAARGALDSAGRAIEKALFGDLPSAEPVEPERPDPFAKLKAAELAEKKAAAEQRKLDRELDAELATLKDRLGK